MIYEMRERERRSEYLGDVGNGSVSDEPAARQVEGEKSVCVVDGQLVYKLVGDLTRPSQVQANKIPISIHNEMKHTHTHTHTHTRYLCLTRWPSPADVMRTHAPTSKFCSCVQEVTICCSATSPMPVHPRPSVFRLRHDPGKRKRRSSRKYA